MRVLKAKFAAFDATRLLAAAVANPETLEKTQKIVGTNSRKYLKTKEESPKTNLKRTQIECTMRALNAKFVAFDATQFLAADRKGKCVRLRD